jgi:hypothetical protein
MVFAFGDNRHGQCNVPPLPRGTTYVAVAAGDGVSAALRSDGQIVAWGDNTYHQCEVPSLQPGQRWLAVAAGGYAMMGLADTGYRIYGDGCAGSLGVTRLVPQHLANVGTSMRVEVGPLPQDIAIFVTGASATNSVLGPLPLEGSRFGMPGCFLRASTDLYVVLAGTAGWATFSFPVPAQPWIVGLPLYQQAVVGAPGANPAGLVLSRAGASMILP